MAILSTKGLSQSWGDFDLFRGISVTIPNDGKVGLVGPNGIGKSTLLQILAGINPASTGDVHLAKSTRIGYLRQEAMQAFAGRESNSVYAEMLRVFAFVGDMEAQLGELEALLSNANVDEAILEKYSNLQTKFELAGGYTYETDIKRVLSGLGFAEADWQTPLNHLSGGQKTRALLARLLLEKPDLLILDEPTNHLDVAAVEWLEGVLKVWEGALLIVSHDRYFLDRVCATIWEMSRGGVETYRGNYSHYVTQRHERWALREKEFVTMQDKFFKELDYIKRNIARDSTTKMAVGRLKRLTREVKVVQAGGMNLLLNKSWAQVLASIEIDGSKWEVPDVESAIKGMRNPVERPPQLSMKLNAKSRSGKIVLRTADLAIGYPNHDPLFVCEDIELMRLERAALIGPNGAGKTTFLKTILDDLQAAGGSATLGASLKVGYFSQAHDSLDRENTVIDELIKHHEMGISAARNYLAQYLFRGEDVYKPIKLLSGGESGRLALSILALQDANLLLLDEPTNHLDIHAQEVLQATLNNFDGTVLMVSHDRYLINELATQIWEIVPASKSQPEGKLKVYGEGYQAYLKIRDGERGAEKTAKAAERKQEKAEKAAAAKNEQTTGLSKNELRRRQERVAEIEAQIEASEAALAAASAELETASASGDYTAIEKASGAYATIEASLETLMDEWAALSE